VSVLVLFPIALLILAVGGALAWPVAYRAGREAWSADDFDTIPDTLPHSSVLIEELQELRAIVAELTTGHAQDTGHEGAHRWEVATGSATQVRRLAGLREPTEEFRAIVIASYPADELPVSGLAFLKAHQAAIA
jgi:hypothetical protein